jgi:hypothetical protein
MLLPSWLLLLLCTGLGFSGLLMAYKHKRAAIVPMLIVLAIA